MKLIHPYRVHSLQSIIFSPEIDFEQKALEVFRFQIAHCSLYREYCQLLGVNSSDVKSSSEIPHLPIELFKQHRIVSLSPGDVAHGPGLHFRSSGTGGPQSQHHVLNPSMYRTSFMTCFEQFYGPPSAYRILALLPGYLERADSSLVYMVRALMEASAHPDNGFYLNEFEALNALLQKPCDRHTLLIGVSFALLDFAERHPAHLPHTTIMETGGMKGRREEITRGELHQLLQAAFGLDGIHSEYGMTELLSQAYAKKEGRFHCPPWMRIGIRELNDPLSPAEEGRSGAINVTDLANMYSCSFIATSDLGRRAVDGSFEVLGRVDYSDTRGCNLMVAEP